MTNEKRMVDPGSHFQFPGLCMWWSKSDEFVPYFADSPRPSLELTCSQARHVSADVSESK